MEKRVWEWVALTEYRHRDAPCTSRCVRDEAMRLRGILEGEKHD
jgi:hypothetical protein